MRLGTESAFHLRLALEVDSPLQAISRSISFVPGACFSRLRFQLTAVCALFSNHMFFPSQQGGIILVILMYSHPFGKVCELKAGAFLGMHQNICGWIYEFLRGVLRAGSPIIWRKPLGNAWTVSSNGFRPAGASMALMPEDTVEVSLLNRLGGTYKGAYPMVHDVVEALCNRYSLKAFDCLGLINRRGVY